MLFFLENNDNLNGRGNLECFNTEWLNINTIKHIYSIPETHKRYIIHLHAIFEMGFKLKFSRSRPVAMMYLCKLCKVGSIITSSLLWVIPSINEWILYTWKRDKVNLVNNSLQTPNLFLLKMVAGGHLDFFSTHTGQIHQTTLEIDFPYPKTPERTPYMRLFLPLKIVCFSHVGQHWGV